MAPNAVMEAKVLLHAELHLSTGVTALSCKSLGESCVFAKCYSMNAANC